jgi:DNA-binding transcriptional MerR regulator
MKIELKTRKNISTDRAEDIFSYILPKYNKLKRLTEYNMFIFEDLLSRDYNSASEFHSICKALFKPAYKDLKLFGWSFDEIAAEKSKRSAAKLLTREISIQKSGLSKEEYLRSNSSFSKAYWLKRGYSIEDAVEKIREIQSVNSKKSPNQSKKENSPRTLDYWIKRGYSNPEEKRSMWQRESSQRCVEYWMKRGSSFDEALTLVSDTQRESANYYYSSTSPEEIRKTNRLCEEYYISKGMSPGQIKLQLADNGRTFSLELCISKYGDADGFEIWSKRQELWQNTLKNKSQEEIKAIRAKQGTINSTLNFRSLWSELNIPGIFYLIDIGDNKVKIGITSVGMKKRYGVNIIGKPYTHWPFEDIHHAFRLEQVIKRQFANRICRDDYGIFGWTEVLNETNVEEIAIRVSELLNKKDDLNQLFESIRK